MDKESPQIECVRVQDSVECAKMLRGGTAGFGIFSAETMVLMAALNYTDLNVLMELKHRDRLNRKCCRRFELIWILCVLISRKSIILNNSHAQTQIRLILHQW